MSQTTSAYSTDLKLDSDPASARRFQEAVESQLREHQFNEKEIFGVRLALEEALVNAIKHGNHFARDKKVHVSYSINSKRFDILIRDEGCGFNPSDVPDPTAFENLERPCGRGLMLMRHYMSEVQFVGSGCAVSMSKIRNGSS